MTKPLAPRILCLGDSITDGDTWPQMAAASALQVIWCNAGVGGETAAQAGTRLRGHLELFKPSMVVLLIGTNDALLGVTPESFLQSVTVIVRAPEHEDAQVQVDDGLTNKAVVVKLTSTRKHREKKNEPLPANPY